MDIKCSDTSFGMSMYSPKRLDMPYFKRLLAEKTGKIDTKALGEMVVKQAENLHADIRYVRSAAGDMFQVFSVHNPKEVINVPIKNSSGCKTGWKKFTQWLKDRKIDYERDPQGNWDTLPVELRKAGEIADKMNAQWAK